MSLRALIRKRGHPPQVGNFLLPVSQQLSPLISFGQNIIGEGQVQLYIMGENTKGAKANRQELTGSAVYAPTDDFSFYLNVPTNKKDPYFQLEYAFLNDQTSFLVDQATFVANVTMPVWGVKNPPSDQGAYRFFVGSTLARMYTDWYLFVSPGVTLPAPYKGRQLGNQFLYQGGIGRFLFSIDSDWIFAFLVEATGQYTQKNRIRGVIDPNTGGNVVTITPSLWVSSEHIIIQLGAGFLPVQNLFGNQDKDQYSLVANLGWTF